MGATGRNCHRGLRSRPTLTIEPFTLCATIRPPSVCATSRPLLGGVDYLGQIGLVPVQRWACRRNTSVFDNNLNWTETRFSGCPTRSRRSHDGDVHHQLGLALGSGDVIDSFGSKLRRERAPRFTRAPPRRKKGAKNRPRPLEPPVTSTCNLGIPNRSFIANSLASWGTAASLDLAPHGMIGPWLPSGTIVGGGWIVSVSPPARSAGFESVPVPD